MPERDLEMAWLRNRKFLNQTSYPKHFFRDYWLNQGKIATLEVGKCPLPSGRLVLADPLAYLGTEYALTLAGSVPPGEYPLQLALLQSPLAGERVAAARLLFSEQPAQRWELAMPQGYTLADIGKPGVFALVGVDTGLICFADQETEGNYREFRQQWRLANPQGNIYDDYFAQLFQKNGSHLFLPWQTPWGQTLVFFSSGLGDGVYSAYWGWTKDRQPGELVIPLLNPKFF